MDVSKVFSRVSKAVCAGGAAAIVCGVAGLYAIRDPASRKYQLADEVGASGVVMSLLGGIGMAKFRRAKGELHVEARRPAGPGCDHCGHG